MRRMRWWTLQQRTQRKQGCWRDTQLEAAWVRMREVREQLPRAVNCSIWTLER